MYDVVVVGGGWAGCASALAATKLGATSVVLERTSEILGAGLVAGRMRSNARFAATEEAVAMGGGELFRACDVATIHRNVPLPGSEHTCFYDIFAIEPLVAQKLAEAKVEVRRRSRVKDIRSANGVVYAVVLDSGEEVEGKVFVDATGTTGPQGMCSKHGVGCVMCHCCCPSFGPRLSLSGKMGIREGVGRRSDGGIGVVNAALLILKQTVSANLVSQLEKRGCMLIPISRDMETEYIDIPKTGGDEILRENLLVVDNGTIKIMYRTCIALEKLRRLEGFERAKYYEPLCGGQGNSVSFLVVTPRDNTMRVVGTKNLLCAGEKQGLMVGCTEAIMTGTVAGYNATRMAFRQTPVEMPQSTIIGEAIAFTGKALQRPEGYTQRYSLLSGGLAARITDLGLYQSNVDQIRERIARMGLDKFFIRG